MKNKSTHFVYNKIKNIKREKTMEMSIPITTKIMIKEIKDIEKYARFMEDNGLKINKSEIARQLNISRKTVAKYVHILKLN